MIAFTLMLGAAVSETPSTSVKLDHQAHHRRKHGLSDAAKYIDRADSDQVEEGKTLN